MLAGTFSNTDIRKAISSGEIISRAEISDVQVQPSSLDLTIGRKIWCLPYSSIPQGRIEDYLDGKKSDVEDKDETYLHKRVLYVAEINEELRLPGDVEGKSEPKSSTGRIDVHVRLLTQGGQAYDQVRPGYNGKLFLEIFSKTFDLKIKSGTSLNQLRLSDNGCEFLSKSRLEELCTDQRVIFTGDGKAISPDEFLEDDSISMTLDLSGDNPGYIGRDDAPPLDLSRFDHGLLKYFDVPKVFDEGLVTRPGAFYLLRSRERVRIPRRYGGEMVSMETNLGEFRAHYAGFFDPGFNARAVLEVRNIGGSPFLLRHGQRIANLKLLRLKTKPSIIYGRGIGSNYQGQQLNPGKYFKAI